VGLFLPSTWYIVLRNGFSAGWFTPHPPLLSLALTLFTVGIIPLQPPTPGSGSTRTKRTNTHQAILGGLAIPAMAVGVAAMWMNKHVHSAQHFTTWHATFGLVTLGWVVLQALMGGLSFWLGGKAFGGGGRAKRVYKYHRYVGGIPL
jgi:cytochrome b-561 domain-containing protein 2